LVFGTIQGAGRRKEGVGLSVSTPLPWREGNIRGGGPSRHCEFYLRRDAFPDSDEAILWFADLGFRIIYL